MAYNDPCVPTIKLTREHPHLAGRTSQPIGMAYDAILISTAHDEYLGLDFTGFSCPVIDTRNCVQRRPKHYYQA